MNFGRSQQLPPGTYGIERGRRTAGRVLGVAVAGALAFGLGPATAWAAPPPNPSDSDISAAQAEKDAAAAEVGAISAQLAAAQSQVDAARAASALALDEYQAKAAEYDAAQLAADTAAAAAVQATADLDASRQDLADFARTSYIEGSTFQGAAALLSADGPAQMIERAALLEASGANSSDVVDTTRVLQQQATAADLAARDALTVADGLKQEAATALSAAQASETSARSQAAALADQQVALNEQLQQAQQTLLGLEGARKANEEYAAAQAALARQQARDQEAARAAAEAAARRAASASSPTASRPSSSSSSGGGSSSSGSSSSSSSKSSTATSSTVDTTPAGSGSAGAAETAISAGMRYLGTTYAWGGGGTKGPGPGIAPDEGVVGFDCSGLTQYAYARAGISIPRNSRAQYAALPKVGRSDLQAGDLVFWATSPGDPSTIYHVGIYLGGNKVLHAPQSNDVVKVSTMWWGGYAGAVRPSA
ncbi:C40 family peptidase [Goekera deserti]|uniref:C40 family peptidase n=1 Tax=Goekera deserti TaxID=2497753 RepID=UPI001F19FEB5|nr:C40 family peptidase [Goekera deserti]